ncbi:MAG: hypothetical protein PHP45_03380 [Elusimicrobiales bacterium]|nr:hypothetical protein [Elusimicrobiales bacterium]
MPGKCPFCNQDAENIPVTGYPATTYTCKFCGEFTLARNAYDDEVSRMTKEQKMRIASFTKARTIRGQEPIWIFSRQEYCDPEFKVSTAGLDSIFREFPADVSDRLDRILFNLNRSAKYFGEKISIDVDNDLPLFFSSNVEELLFICKSLQEQGLIEQHFKVSRPVQDDTVIISGDIAIHITASGLNHISELERANSGNLSNQGFVAMAFISKKYDLKSAFEQGIKLAFEDCNYKAFRTDYHEHNDVIDDVMISEIRKSKFMVADLTEHRNGVYFEAGMMYGLGREVIYTVHDTDADNTHFDLAHRNQVRWKTPADLREKLANRIKATII